MGDGYGPLEGLRRASMALSRYWRATNVGRSALDRVDAYPPDQKGRIRKSEHFHS